MQEVVKPKLRRSAVFQVGVQDQYDCGADVVIVGLGGAGAAAAIAAADEGASVIVLEKMAQGGGNTAVSGGGFINPSNADDAYEYLSRTYAFGGDEMDPELVRAFCRQSCSVLDWIRQLEPDVQTRIWGYANFPALPHSDTITKYTVAGPDTGGRNLFALLLRQVEQRSAVRVLYGTSAQDLLMRKGRVVGVSAVQDGRLVLIEAKKGVILACGGYENDPESLRNYCQASEVYNLGNPGNTGDGLRMAQAAGARLWHMTAYSCPLGFRVPGCQASVPFTPMTPGYIWVDRNGQRFCNEAGIDLHSCLYAVNRFDPISHCYPAIPCWLVMDEAGRLAGPVTHRKFGYAAVSEHYVWSDGFEREISSGVFLKANTLEELAERMGIPAQALVRTVDRWNADIAKGRDTVFGRLAQRPQTEKDSMVGATARKLGAPLAKGPFYAAKLYPALLNTQGGPKRDANARVLSTNDSPIPGLYVAGELGSIWGTIYQGSCNVTEALVFGVIAGRTAALS